LNGTIAQMKANAAIYAGVSRTAQRSLADAARALPPISL